MKHIQSLDSASSQRDTKKQQVESKTTHKRRNLLLTACAFVFVAAIFGTAGTFYYMTQHQRIAFGVFVGPIHIGGKTPSEARSLLKTKQAAYMEMGIPFSHNEHTLLFDISDAKTTFAPEQTVEDAYKIGRTGTWWMIISDRFHSIKNQKHVKLAYTIDSAYEDAFIQNAYQLEQLPVDASLVREGGTHAVQAGIPGKKLFPGILREKIDMRIQQLSSSKSALPLYSVEPRTTTADAALARQFLIDFQVNAVTLTKDDQSFVVSPETLQSWITFEPVLIEDVLSDRLNPPNEPDHSKTATAQQEIFIPLRPISVAAQDAAYETYLVAELKNNLRHKHAASISAFITDELTPGIPNQNSYVLFPSISSKAASSFFTEVNERIGTPSKDARLHIVNGKVEVLEPEQNGIEVDTRLTIEAVRNAISHSQQAATITMRTSIARVSAKSIETLGITELLGTGTSNYTGSSTNRIRNVSVGTSRFHGLLVPPGEEVSAGKTIGPVDRSHGFVPELVILQNRTVPQDGGGLCQVTSTLFRATMNTGLEVTARRNHSYSVRYYNPPGTDATIYYPHTDFKFRNDTAHYILIQSYLKEQEREVVFEIYGTKDGRNVQVGTPYSYDQKPDGSLKSVWTRKVYKSDGTLLHDDEFRSIYRSPSQFPHASAPKPQT